MTDVKVDYERLKVLNSDISKNLELIYDDYEGFSNAVDGLYESWEGSSKKKMQDCLSEWAECSIKFLNALTAINNFLTAYLENCISLDAAEANYDSTELEIK